MNTRLNIKKLNENIVQKHEGSKQVRLKQLGSKKVGFKQLGPGGETRFHRVQDEKCVWFEVELQGAQRDCKAEVFQLSNNDTAVAQRRLEYKQPEEKTNTDCLGANGNVAEYNKMKESMKTNLRKLLMYKVWLKDDPQFEVPTLDEDAEYQLCLSVTPKTKAVLFTNAFALSYGACGYGVFATSFYNGHLAAGVPSIFKLGSGCGACFQVQI
uniref:Expansin-like A1 n=1 Tax=Tanacetum cinerariifolium TaxID=118510 RepID=A0A6L2JRS8_TANCI|nr:expansin-like A1 [Tanacetum cinerariifolium]